MTASHPTPEDDDPLRETLETMRQRISEAAIRADDKAMRST